MSEIETLHIEIISLKEINSQFVKILFNRSVIYTKFEHLSKYYEIIEIQAFQIKSKIIFVLHFPSIHLLTFEFYHLYSIPYANSTTIFLSNTFVFGYGETQFHTNSRTDCDFQILETT